MYSDLLTCFQDALQLLPAMESFFANRNTIRMKKGGNEILNYNLEYPFLFRNPSIVYIPSLGSQKSGLTFTTS